MYKKNKKAAVRAVFFYLLLTFGLWMFLDSYANSYNRLSSENIAPASLTLTKDSAKINVLEKSCTIDLSRFSGKNRSYCLLYLASPDEIRLSAYLIALCNRI